MRVKELREERQGLVNQIQKMVIEARKDNRGLNTEEQASFDKLDAEQCRLETEINGLEKIERWDNRVLDQIKTQTPTPAFNAKHNNANLEHALRYMASRDSSYANEFNSFRDDAEMLGLTQRSLELPLNTRAFGDGTLKAGTETEVIPTTLASEVYQKLLAHGGILPYLNTFNTSQGGPFDLPTADNTSLVAALVAEGVDDAEAALTFSKVTFGSYLISSGICLVTYEMLRDANFNMSSYITDVLSEAVARKISYYLISGTGSSQPTGISASSGGLATGVTAASATAITYGEIVDMIYSVDQAYHGNARWVVGTGFRKFVMKLVDDNLRPLWTEQNVSGISAGTPATILGFPVHVDANLPASLSAAGKVAAFGDFQKSTRVRFVGNLNIAQSNERYFEKRVSALVAFLSMDSKNVDTGAAKVLKMAAS